MNIALLQYWINEALAQWKRKEQRVCKKYIIFSSQKQSFERFWTGQFTISILTKNMIYQDSRTAAMIWDINRGLEPMGNWIG